METTYNVRFHGIEIVERHLARIQVNPTDTFKFDIKTQSVLHPELKVIVTFVRVDIIIENNKKSAGNILCGFGYLVENFEQVFEKNEQGQFNIPTDFENTLKVISISTLRGIMYSEFRGTQLHGAILPIILVDQLVPSSGSIVEVTNSTTQ